MDKDTKDFTRFDFARSDELNIETKGYKTKTENRENDFGLSAHR